MSADAWGIEEEYRDAFGTRRRVADDVRAAIRGCMGPPPADEPAPVAVVRPGGRLPARGEVTLEDGTGLPAATRLPSDAPIGYHRLQAGDRETLLLCGPGRCPVPDEARRWGWSAQLYATRSRDSWGIGDLADLRALAAWSAGLGASMLLVNPLHAAAPVAPQQRSPYFPSTRRFRNPLYLRVEEVGGAAALDDELERLAAQGRALNDGVTIDRDAAYGLKFGALERIWAMDPPRDGLDSFRGGQGAALREWATYAVIAETHGPAWSRWPEQLRRPHTAAVRRFAAAHRDRIAFHEWVQWLLDEQLAAAQATIGLVHDVPVGVDRDGADAWAWQAVLALDASIGAPPDVFNRAGQDWGLPPFVPHRLRAAGYRPFIDTVRASLRHAAGLRIDHVLGLFRMWWVPLGDDPRRGGYVRYPTGELLEILAIEAERAGAFVVGEDLGTVGVEVRRTLARHGMLSYRLAYFERSTPDRYPEACLAAVTTHDLPTIAGTWLGGDLEVQRQAGVPPDEKGLRLLRRRLARAAGVEGSATLDEVLLGVHRALAASPALLVSATLDDALRVEVRPNLPGTVDERPNWAIPLPLPLEELMADPFVAQLAASLSRGDPEA